MPPTKEPRIRNTGLGRMSFGGVLALSLIAAIAGQTTGITFAQNPPPPVASTQEDEAASDVLKSRVHQIPKDSYVEVRLTDGQTIEGRLGEVVAEGFMLQTVSKDRLTNRLVRFEELQSVAPVGGAQPRGGTVELTVDHGKVTVGVLNGGVNFGLTFYTPAKAAQNVAAHVAMPIKAVDKRHHSDP